MFTCGRYGSYIGYDSDIFPETLNGDCSDILTIDLDRTVLRIIESKEEL